MHSNTADLPRQSSTGNYLRESFHIYENTKHPDFEALIHCFIKGLIIFCGSFGTITAVLSEFDVIYDYATTFFMLLLTSMTLALIHIRRYLFNVGYISVFVLFTAGVVRYRNYVNSGFQALLNIVNEAYGEHYLLLFTRESTEVISDRFMTVTAAAVFIGIFWAILLNVALFQGIMDTFSLTFLTILPLFLGIYIGKYPSFIPLTFIFFSLFASYLLGHNGHYHFVRPEGKKINTEYYITRYPDGKKLKRYPLNSKKRFFKRIEIPAETLKTQRILQFHKSNSRHMVGLCVISLFLALSVSILSSVMMTRSEAEALRPPEVKQDADEYVKLFVQNGFSGLLNRYSATGGLSNGRLGGVSSVRPSYTPNLYATYVPYAYDTVYLRAFTGQLYMGDSFLAVNKNLSYKYPDVSSENVVSYRNYISMVEGDTLKKLMDEGKVDPMSGKMLIENVGAGNNHIFLPYYVNVRPDDTKISRDAQITGSLFEISQEDADLNDDHAMEVAYIPYSSVLTDLTALDRSEFDDLRSDEEKEFFDLYEKEIKENYLQIPEELKPALEEVKGKIHSNDDPASLIFNIRNYFYINYTYSLSPGTTPVNEDFVRYFLTEQNSGYCAHFAAASTMLFRYYGIPARYCEGYVITQSAVTDRAVATEYKTEDFFTGTNSLGELPVVSVEITDGEAHAWTEIFIDGFGWIPVDMTPPSTDEDEATYSDFLFSLSSIFGADASPDGGSSSDYDNSNAVSDFFTSLSPTGSPLVFTILVILFIAMLFPVLKAFFIYLISLIRVKRAYMKGEYDIVIEASYRKILRKLKKRLPDEELRMPEEVASVLCKLIEAPHNSSLKKDLCEESSKMILNLMEKTEKIIYSPYRPDKKETDEILKVYRLLGKIRIKRSDRSV